MLRAKTTDFSAAILGKLALCTQWTQDRPPENLDFPGLPRVIGPVNTVAQSSISRRAYQSTLPAYSWEEIFEAGPYYRRISELLEQAQRYAVFVGWQIDSRLPLSYPIHETLREKILRLVEAKPDFHFYFLMWDHAYFYVLEREAWQGRIWDNIHPRVHFIFDNKHPFGGSHHEKICLIDGKVAFCGGIDLCDERWDSPQHLYTDPRRSLSWKNEKHGPYHDIAVQVTGPICNSIHAHVESRWRGLSSIPFPEAHSWPALAADQRSQSHQVYLSRTLTHLSGALQKCVTREVEFLFRDLISAAQKRIILESQYYWSDEINHLLIQKIERMRGLDFELILILADLRELKGLTRQLSLYELRLLTELEEAAKESGTRLTVGYPQAYSPELSRSKPIYIHSKVVIIDDSYLSIGSANLADRALRLDTEVHLTLEAKNDSERAHIQRFSTELLKHWNIGGINEPLQAREIRFHVIHAREAHQKLRFQSSALTRLLHDSIPWKLLFDPKIPWFYLLQKRFKNLPSSPIPWIFLISLLLWMGSASLSLFLARLFEPSVLASWTVNHPSLWRILYAYILTSVWFAPIPYTLVAILSLFQLGFKQGVALSLSSLWVAGLFGYWITRSFPNYLTRFYRPSGPSWLPKRLGLRRFPATLSMTLDPRLALRSKIAYLGLYCVPFPWLVLSLLIVLPMALDFMLWLIHFSIPQPLAENLHQIAPKLVVLLSGVTLSRLFGSTLLKTKRLRKKSTL